MLVKDKIKSGVALGLVLILIITFLVVGKESIIMKYIGIFSLITWITAMILINHKYK